MKTDRKEYEESILNSGASTLLTVEDKVSTDKSCLIDLFRFHVTHFLPFPVPMSDRESNSFPTNEGQLDSKPVASHTRRQSL